jgi:hypothetical protein
MISPQGDTMKIYVDIDETICHTPEGGKYKESTPIQPNIDKINALYDQGHIITYWTARGSRTGKDWRELTEIQLQDWGAKHHELILKKPAYDVFICDKVLNSRAFFKDEHVWWPDGEKSRKQDIEDMAPQGAVGWMEGENTVTYFDSGGKVLLTRKGRIPT